MKRALRLTAGVCSVLPTPVERTQTLLAMIVFTTIIHTTPPTHATAQSADPTSMSLAGSVLARIDHLSTAFTTPAITLAADPWHAQLATSMNRTGPDNRPEGTLHVTRSLDSTSNVGVGIGSIEAGAWRELQGSVSISRSFGRVITGLRLRTRRTSIAKYGSSFVPSLDVGVAVPVSSGVHLALLVANVSRSKRGRSPVEQLFAAGVAVRADSTITISADARSVVGSPLSLRSGISWRPVENAVGRVGLGSEPERIGVGLGIELGNMSIDVGTDFRFETGTSFALGGGVSW